MSQCSTVLPALPVEITSAQIAEHEGLVRWVVRQQWLGGLPFEAAVQEGRIALWHALQGYDPARGYRFSTYAVPAIAHAVWRAVSQQGRTWTWFPLPPATGGPTGEGEWVAEVWEAVERRQVYAALAQMVEALPPRLRQIIAAHYGLGGQPPQTFAAIGQTMSISKQRVQQLHVLALLWLAHPVHSLPLRQLLERHRRVDYQEARARRRKGRRVRQRTRRKEAAP